jgi:hypothetical protein
MQKEERRCGSHGRVSALQEQSPEFKSQSHQKQKKEAEGRETILTAKNLYVLNL